MKTKKCSNYSINLIGQNLLALKVFLRRSTIIALIRSHNFRERKVLKHQMINLNDKLWLKGLVYGGKG